MNPRQSLNRHLNLILAMLVAVLVLSSLGSLGYAWSLSRQVSAALALPPPGAPPKSPEAGEPTEAKSELQAKKNRPDVKGGPTEVSRTDIRKTSATAGRRDDRGTSGTMARRDSRGTTETAARPDTKGTSESAAQPDAKGRSSKQGQMETKSRPARQVVSNARSGRSGRSGQGGGDSRNVQLPESIQKLLKEHPLFGSPPRQEPRLESIFDDSALVNGQWVRVGGSVGAGKLLEIKPYGVVLEWEGQRRELSLWSDLSGSEGGGGGGMSSPPPPPPSPSRPDRPTRAPASARGARLSTTPPQPAPGAAPASVIVINGQTIDPSTLPNIRIEGAMEGGSFTIAD